MDTDILVEQGKLIRLGHVAVFYVPVQKLDLAEFGENDQTPRQMFEVFLMDNYNAYTLELSDTQGFWREHHKSEIFRDENVRYEVSFNGSKRVAQFVNFLSKMCYLMKEQAIYLTMGYQSWLVLPEDK